MFKSLKSLFVNNKLKEHKAYERGYHDGLSEGKKTSATTSSQDGRPKTLHPSGPRDPLTKKDLRQARNKRLEYLNKIEEIVRSTTAGNVRGASIIKRKGGGVEVYEVNSKDEALELISKAKKGELNIIM